MTQIIPLNSNPQSTEDCKKLLNSLIKQANWKRLYKLTYLRCFTNEYGDIVTIGEDGEGESQAHTGVDIINEVKAINLIAKFYYTHDYGEVFYNPYSKTLWISGGDGGYCYSSTPLKDPENDDLDWGALESKFIEFNKHPETSFITDVTWEAECNPDDIEFLRVGTINLFEF